MIRIYRTACAIVKADRNRLWWGSSHGKYGTSRAFEDAAVRFEHKVMIRIYKCPCACRAIELLAREDCRRAERPFLLAILVIRSGIGGQGKNADKHFAAVNPESQASTTRSRPYSRARGAFAEVSLEGSTVRQDNDANKDLYRKKIDAKEIVLDGAVNAPTSASTLISTLDKASPVNKSKS